MCRQADAAGLQIEFVPAIDATAGSLRQRFPSMINSPFGPAIYGRPAAWVEIACYQSHRRCLRKLIENEASGAFILEDDVVVSNRARAALDFIDEVFTTKHNAGIAVYLAHPTDFELNVSCVLGRRTAITSPSGEFKLQRVRRCRKALNGAFGYYVNRAAAESILEIESELIGLADDWGRRIRSCAVDELWVLTTPIVFHVGDALPSQLAAGRNISIAHFNPAGGGASAVQKSAEWRRPLRALRSVADELLAQFG